MAYSDEVLADSPLAYYRLGEASGTTLVDSSGNGHNGTYTGGATLGASSVVPSITDNTAVAFSGATGSGATVVHALWLQNMTRLTAEAWFIPTSITGSAPIMARADTNQAFGSQWSWFIHRSGSQLLFWAFVNNGTVHAELSSASGLIAVGNRYHVAMTFDGTTVKGYLNGAEVASGALSGNLSGSNQGLGIGRQVNGGGYFAGTMDEAALYDHALTPTRISAHYAAGTAAAGVAGSFAVALPKLSANLAGAYVPPARTGTLAATMPALTASLAGAYVAPAGGPVTGTLAGVIPGLAASISGGYTAPVSDGQHLTTLTADKVNGRQRSGRLNLRIVNPLDVDATDEGAPAADGSTVRLHKQPYRIISPSLPAPTLVDGRPQ